MSIWFRQGITIADFEHWGKNTLVEHLSIRFTAIGDDFLKATMPVDQRTIQPYGLLHGGASAALAETMGSTASALVIDPEKFICVGIEINANHIRSVRSGHVTGTCTPVHMGSTIHVWDIRIYDENTRLTCVSRLTMAILPKKSQP